MRQVLPGLNRTGPLQRKTTLTAHPTVTRHVLQWLNLAGPL